MSQSERSEAHAANLGQPTKTVTEPGGMVLARLFAQNHARRSWLVGRKFAIGVSIGGLAVILGIVVATGTLLGPSGAGEDARSRIHAAKAMGATGETALAGRRLLRVSYATRSLLHRF